jgi:hypothetical protein
VPSIALELLLTIAPSRLRRNSGNDVDKTPSPARASGDQYSAREPPATVPPRVRLRFATNRVLDQHERSGPTREVTPTFLSGGGALAEQDDEKDTLCSSSGPLTTPAHSQSTRLSFDVRRNEAFPPLASSLLTTCRIARLLLLYQSTLIPRGRRLHMVNSSNERTRSGPLLLVTDTR